MTDQHTEETLLPVNAPGAMPADEDVPAGVGEQFGRTRASFSRLLRAHVDLLRAEMGEIIDQLKVIATQAGIALALALLVGNMLYIGGFLFIGEWLFGSIGWGLAHGVLFGLALIAILVLAILGAPARTAALGFLVAVVLTVVIALVCGSNVGYNTAAYLAGQVVSPFNSAGVVALLAGLVIGAMLFAILLALVGGRSGLVAGLVVGALLGMPIGWLIAGAPWTWPPAVGFAITIGLISWPILAALFALPGLDIGERFARLYPRQSIEAAEETRAWLEEQWQSRRPKLGRR